MRQANNLSLCWIGSSLPESGTLKGRGYVPGEARALNVERPARQGERMANPAGKRAEPPTTKNEKSEGLHQASNALPRCGLSLTNRFSRPSPVSSALQIPIADRDRFNTSEHKRSRWLDIIAHVF